MAIRKREGKKGVSWQIDYLDPTGRRIRQSFRKKKDAEAEHGKRISLKAEKRYLDVKKDYLTTLGELTSTYEENFKNQTFFKDSKHIYMRHFRDYFGKDTLLGAIRYVDVETYRSHLRDKLTKHGRLRADATVNREMATLHRLFSKGVEWEMMEQNPFDRGKGLKLKENNTRVRFLNEQEITALLAECEKFPHLYRITLCALHTGMRRGEILHLRWDQIRNGFIYLEKTKTKEKREIPINQDLSELFKRIRQEYGLVDASKDNRSGLVFTYARKELKGIYTGFKRAVKRAGIENFRFHDLRHTFASLLVMRGASLKEVQELLGHKSITMTMRYAHLGEEHKKKAVSLLNGLTLSKGDVTKVSQIQNSVSNPL